MKAIKFFAITAMAAAMITSCSNEDELSQSNYPSDNIIRITAGVNNAKTRAEGAAGTPLKNPLSLTVVNKNTENTELAKKYTYVDQKFTKDENGAWNCSEAEAQAQPLLWQNKETLVDIAALAPAQEGKFDGVYNKETRNFSSFSYSVADDQSTSSDNNDLLYYYAKDFKPGESLKDGKLSIQMNHAFCMIDIVVTLGTEFNKPEVLKESPIVKVTLGGTKIAANVDVTNAASVVTASGEATDITTTKGSFTKATNAEVSAISNFSCITIPQNVAANTFKVSLKTAGKRYEWTSAEPVLLQSGYRYTLKLSMGNDVVLLKDAITASTWTEVAGGSLETD